MSGIGRADKENRSKRPNVAGAGGVRAKDEAASAHPIDADSQTAEIKSRASLNTSSPPPQAAITSIGLRRGKASINQTPMPSDRSVSGSGGHSKETEAPEKKDIRSLAQSIVDEEALGVTVASGQLNQATNAVDWLNSHRIHLSFLLFLIAAVVILLPAWLEQTQRQKAHTVQRTLQEEASRLADEIGPDELSQQIRERELDEVRGAYRLRHEGIVSRLRSSGLKIRPSDVTVRLDFENEGLMLGVLLDRGGDEGTLAIWANTHGKPFGRALPDPDLMIVMQDESAYVAVVIQTSGMALLALWIIPPLLRRRET